MSYPAAPLQKAIYDAIVGSATVATAMGGTARAYDRVPPDAVFPYITIPDGDFIDDGDTCETDAFEVYVDLQVWSRAVGNVECKTVSGVLRDVILAGLTITGWNATVIEYQRTFHFMDPDGETARSRVTFRFLIEPA